MRATRSKPSENWRQSRKKTLDQRRKAFKQEAIKETVAEFFCIERCRKPCIP